MSPRAAAVAAFGIDGWMRVPMDRMGGQTVEQTDKQMDEQVEGHRGNHKSMAGSPDA